MTYNFSVWLVILVAVLAANLPFINQRWLAIVPRQSPKPLWGHALELVLMYLLVVALGMALEQSGGQIYPKIWEFYAVTASLFLTLAFPGFVYRYLLHRRG